ncbi:HEL180Cp [Eremothecium sinecaudum]|uniref:Kynureninase n=1 Tax=Eremothecium sinecaudum TaxID=45286 RepID=A0A0X8HSM4_9SACH|nr:HEL180Cp [Eremothecium sinecaudum]AMD21101.1 HEL180Cp [Eremothecium sinecaudum]
MEQIRSCRDDFCIPTFKSLGIVQEADSVANEEVRYFCGNSLGLMPRSTRAAVERELDAWAARGVEGHFSHPNAPLVPNWIDIEKPLGPLLAPIVGALNDEVAVMGSLTANLNALMVAFYRPQGRRVKILFEKGSFSSDFHAIWNQALLHGLDPNHVIEQVGPRPGEETIRTEDILARIDECQDTLALVCLPGVQYYTGQLFDIQRITAHAHRIPGVVVGWDLAHAVGNVSLQLHDWGVDFACWCSYKYLNSGPGGIGGIFVHERHCKGDMARLAGWWGSNPKTRFQMKEEYEPIPGAHGFRQSNPSVIDIVALRASLEIFAKFGGIQKVRQHSLVLTGLLFNELCKSKYYIDAKALDAGKLGFLIITPSDPESRGAQLSLKFGPHDDDQSKNTMSLVSKHMREKGIIVDQRRPDVLRLSPAPLYNTIEDVHAAVYALEKAFESIDATNN